MACAQVIQLPVVLSVEFEPDIRLGELMMKLGPEFGAVANRRGGIRIVRANRDTKEEETK